MAQKKPSPSPSKRQSTKQQQIKHEEEFIKFLEKQLGSNNYKSNVSEVEYDKQKKKLEKARLKLRLLKGEF